LAARIEFDLLLRWFVWLGVDDPVWDATTFNKNRNDPIVGAVATLASGHAEPLAARHLIEPHAHRPKKVLWVGHEGFATQDFTAEPGEFKVTAHVGQQTNERRAAIDGRTTRQAWAMRAIAGCPR
jgi:hypothetical protein